MKRRKKINPALDLFGEVIITRDDIETWIDIIPKIPASSTMRRNWYKRCWDVADKVRQAKINGTWDDIINQQTYL
ncbi:MAG TPA: hypothetical protein DEP05_10080 [Betaproteobacteria bacterium]|nr:hypothetical protein [Betaproteobacteria bacterium]